MPAPDDKTLEQMPSTLAAAHLPDARADFEFGAATHAGLRRPNNEDHYAVVRRTRSRTILMTSVDVAGMALPRDEAFVLVVADGVGGLRHGELASELILRIGWEMGGAEPAWYMKFREESWPELRAHVADFARRMQQEMVAHAEADPRLASMGTTWTCLYLMGSHALVAHVGDSRAYRFRDGELRQLTRDHTYGRALKDLGATPAEAAPFEHVLTNAFGTHHEGVEIDVNHEVLRDRDRFLLCSDGLFDMVDDRQLAAILGERRAAQATCDRLIAQALEHGGKDNVTVIVADVTVTPG